MKWYKTKWWKKRFAKNQVKPNVNSLKDIKAIIDFLENIQDDPKILLQDLKQLEELEKERLVGSENIMQANLKAQLPLFDKIIQRYEFFQNDVDISGIRVKKVAKEFLRNADNSGLHQMVVAKKKDPKWKFHW